MNIASIVFLVIGIILMIGWLVSMIRASMWLNSGNDPLGDAIGGMIACGVESIGDRFLLIGVTCLIISALIKIILIIIQ